MYSMEKYVVLDFLFQKTYEIILTYKFEVSLMVVFFVLHYISYKKKNLPKKISKFRLSFWLVFLFVIITGILFFYNGNLEDFIYFQF